MKERKPWVATLILVSILAVLVAYIFLVEARREPPPEEGALSTPAPLWEFEGSDVMGITVTKGEQATTVEREGGEWHMIAPEEGGADSGRLDSLVYQVAEIKFTRALADVGDMVAFGLQEPEVQVRVTLALSDGTTINLAVGSENPRGTARYVQKEGDPLVYLVPTSDLQGLLKLVDEPPYPPMPTPPPSPPEIPTVEPSPVPMETPEPTATSRPRPTLAPTP